MDQSKQDFIRFMLESNVLRFGDFVTKSGRKTPYFVNTGNYKTGAQALTLGKRYAALVHAKTQGNFDAIFGPAYKGIPLAALTASMLYADYQIDRPYLYNRKEQKDHGEGGTLVGYPPAENDRIIIVEDVITAGTAIRETLPVLQAAASVRVSDLFISVNRLEKGQNEKTATQEVFDDFGIAVHSIVTVADIYHFLKTTEPYTQYAARMEQYMAKYCVL